MQVWGLEGISAHVHVHVQHNILSKECIVFLVSMLVNQFAHLTHLPPAAAHGGQVACEEDLVLRVFRNWEKYSARMALAATASTETALNPGHTSADLGEAVVRGRGAHRVVGLMAEVQQQRQLFQASDRGPLPQSDAVEAANLPIAEAQADVANVPTGRLESAVGVH